jgi:transcriptional regulator with XRE-family HTH domain
MPASSSPTVRRRRLGIELRRRREAAGRTIEEVAEHLECSPSKVSRIETGRVPVRARDVRDMLDLYGVPPEDREVLVKLSRESKQPGWWRDYNDVLPDWFEMYVGLEAEATTIWLFNSLLVPGLLQTREYTRAIIDASVRDFSDEEVEQLVAFRQARQEMLSRENPPQFWAVLDEAVLRHRIGGAKVLHDQLHHLIERSRARHITLQVIPFTAGAYPSMMTSFTMLGFPEPADPKVVYLEALSSSLLLERPEQVDLYTKAFEQLRAAALSPNDSRELIGAAAKELE